MKRFRAILFDLNGTLIDVRTDENGDGVYRTCANLLAAYGVNFSMEGFRNKYYELMALQRRERRVEHPEFDVVEIFRTLLHEYGSRFTRALPRNVQSLLPGFLAQTFRAATLQHLGLYPGVLTVLEELQHHYRMAAVSDAQLLWAESEMRQTGVDQYLPVRIISGAYGIRKPAQILFQTALDRLQVTPEEALFVGNDTYRDVGGAKNAGMACIRFCSNQGDQRDHGTAPDYVIRRFEELPDAVRFLEERR